MGSDDLFKNLSLKKYRGTLTFSYLEDTAEGEFINHTIRNELFQYNSLLEIEEEIKKYTPIGKTTSIKISVGD